MKKEKWQLSLVVFGTYVILVGLLLLFIPNQVIPLVGFEKANGAWIHLLGFVLSCSAYYYLRAAYRHDKAFARLTVQTRMMAPLVVICLVLAGKAGPALLPFGIIDGLGGIWTWMALRRAPAI